VLRRAVCAFSRVLSSRRCSCCRLSEARLASFSSPRTAISAATSSETLAFSCAVAALQMRLAVKLTVEWSLCCTPEHASIDCTACTRAEYKMHLAEPNLVANQEQGQKFLPALLRFCTELLILNLRLGQRLMA
jgi:hypothetical protein